MFSTTSIERQPMLTAQVEDFSVRSIDVIIDLDRKHWTASG